MSAAKTVKTRALRGRFSDRLMLEKLAITPPVLTNPTTYVISNDPNNAGGILVSKTPYGGSTTITPYGPSQVISLTAALWQVSLEDSVIYCNSSVAIAALQLKNGNNWIMYGGHYTGTTAAANADGTLNSQGIKAIIRCIGSKGVFHEEGLYVDTNGLLGLDSFDVGDNGTNNATLTSAAVQVNTPQTFTFTAIAAASLAAYPINPTALFVYYGSGTLTGIAVAGTDYTVSYSNPTTPTITPLQPLLDKINANIAKDGTQPTTLQVTLQYLQSGNFQHGYCYHTGMYNTAAIKIHADGWQLYGDVGTVAFDHFTLKTSYQGFFTDPQHLVTSYSFRSCNVDYIDPQNAFGYSFYAHDAYTIAQHAGGQVDVPYTFNDFYVGERTKFLSSTGQVSTPAVAGDPDGSFWGAYSIYPKAGQTDAATGIQFGCNIAADGLSATWPAYNMTGQVKRGPPPRGDAARPADGIGAGYAAIAPGYLSTVMDYTAYPVLQSAPVILTNGEVNNPLAATTGVWTNNPTSFKFQWFKNGSAIAGQSGTVAPGAYIAYTGTLPAAGDQVYVQVLAINTVDNTAANSNTVTIFTPTQYANSVQQVTITIPAGSKTATATINPVGPRAYFMPCGEMQTDTASADAPDEFAYPSFTDAGTVTLTRYAASTNSVTMTLSIVDASALLVDSVQFGLASVSGATSQVTALANTVDASRSVAFNIGQLSTTYGAFDKAAAAVQLTDGGHLTAFVGVAPTGSTASVAYQVVQYKAGTINSIQKFGVATSASGNTDTQAITSVNMANTFIAHGGTVTTTNTLSAFKAFLKLATATSVTATRASTAGSSRTHYYTVAEFVSGVLSSMQRGSIAVASAVSATGAITTVGAKAAVNCTGQSTTAANTDEMFASIVKTNATTLTAAKATAGTSTSTIGYEVMEFN